MFIVIAYHCKSATYHCKSAIRITQIFVLVHWCSEVQKKVSPIGRPTDTFQFPSNVWRIVYQAGFIIGCAANTIAGWVGLSESPTFYHHRRLMYSQVHSLLRSCWRWYWTEMPSYSATIVWIVSSWTWKPLLSGKAPVFWKFFCNCCLIRVTLHKSWRYSITCTKKLECLYKLFLFQVYISLGSCFGHECVGISQLI